MTTRTRAIARLFDMVFSDDKPAELEITRHEDDDDDGTPHTDPWFDYTLGDATISVSDKGHGNLVLYEFLADFQDFGALHDLAALLLHPIVQAALPPRLDPQTAIAQEADRILREHFKDEDGEEEEHPAPAGALQGLYVSPDVAAHKHFDLNQLTCPPALKMVDDNLTIRMGKVADAEWERNAEHQHYNPRQPIREVTRLHKRGLVIVDTETEVYVMTEEEWAAQV